MSLKTRLGQLEVEVAAQLVNRLTAHALQHELQAFLEEISQSMTPATVREIQDSLFSNLPGVLERRVGKGWEAHWWLRDES